MSNKVFDRNSTALEVVEGHDLTGYNIIVTGGNSGIGVETVRALAKAGGNVIMTSRNVERGQKVADEIIENTGNKNVHVEQLELDSLENVRNFVQRFLAKDLPLHILINNAGVFMCPLSYTKEGFEKHFGTNHLGHFALTTGLLPSLKAAAKASHKKSRVINISSDSHSGSDFDFEDYNFKNRDYDPYIGYCQSKTTNILFTVELTQRYESEGIVSNAVMPGLIITNIFKDQKEFAKELKVTFKSKTKTVEAGASTSVWAAVADELEGKGGLYLEDCVISKEVNNSAEIEKNMFGYMSYAVDKNNSKKLWDLSEKLIQQ